MNLDNWTEVVLQAAARYLEPLTQNELVTLRETVRDGDPLQRILMKRLCEPMLQEILVRGRDGQTFGDPLRLRDALLYGSVEEVYAGASRIFLNVTRSFLTFWREYLDVAHLTPRTVLQQFLLEMVNANKKVFFPALNIRTPAPYFMFADQQRTILTALGHGLDVDDFLCANPLLARTANPLKGSGCLILAAAIVTGVISLWIIATLFIP